MARVISFINFKGGVGKTTCTVELAVCLARYHGKRVLLIDLDPQTNATFYLLDQPFWMEWVERQGSLKDLFEDFIAHRYTFRIDRAIVQNVAAGGLAVEGLDLLPSHLSLVTIDERWRGSAAPIEACSARKRSSRPTSPRSKIATISSCAIARPIST